MRILILGASGYIGSCIKQALERKGHTVAGTYRTERFVSAKDCGMFQYHLGNTQRLCELLSTLSPDIVISCLTGDFLLQREAHKITADFLKAHRRKLIFISSSNVFDGSLECAHTEKDDPNAASDYGKFKIECETLIQATLGADGVIIRIPEVWGINCPRLETLKRLIQENRPVPTLKNIFVNYTTDTYVASWVSYIIDHQLKGIFHVGSSDLCEYTEFYKKLIALLQLGDPDYQILQNFSSRKTQAVLPGRMEIPSEMQFQVKDVLAAVSAGQ